MEKNQKKIGEGTGCLDKDQIVFKKYPHSSRLLLRRNISAPWILSCEFLSMFSIVLIISFIVFVVCYSLFILQQYNFPLGVVKVLFSSVWEVDCLSKILLCSENPNGLWLTTLNYHLLLLHFLTLSSSVRLVALWLHRKEVEVEGSRVSDEH